MWEFLSAADDSLRHPRALLKKHTRAALRKGNAPVGVAIRYAPLPTAPSQGVADKRSRKWAGGACLFIGTIVQYAPLPIVI